MCEKKQMIITHPSHLLATSKIFDPSHIYSKTQATRRQCVCIRVPLTPTLIAGCKKFVEFSELGTGLGGVFKNFELMHASIKVKNHKSCREKDQVRLASLSVHFFQ